MKHFCICNRTPDGMVESLLVPGRQYRVVSRETSMDGIEYATVATPNGDISVPACWMMPRITAITLRLTVAPKGLTDIGRQLREDRCHIAGKRRIAYGPVTIPVWIVQGPFIFAYVPCELRPSWQKHLA